MESTNLKKLLNHTKENKDKLYTLTDSNYSGIGRYWIHNGKAYRETVFNYQYDKAKNPTRLRQRNDVVYKLSEIPKERYRLHNFY